MGFGRLRSCADVSRAVGPAIPGPPHMFGYLRDTAPQVGFAQGHEGRGGRDLAGVDFATVVEPDSHALTKRFCYAPS